MQFYRQTGQQPKKINFFADYILYWLCLPDFIKATFLFLNIFLKCQKFRRIKPYLKKDSLLASFISCIKLLNAPFSFRFQNNSRTDFFVFLSFFLFILNKTASYKNKLSSTSESDMISKNLNNSDFMFYSENLMTNVSRIIVKYRRKIIANYCQILSFIA